MVLGAIVGFMVLIVVVIFALAFAGDKITELFDSAEDTLEKFKKARKKVEDQLGIGEDFNEEELKYDVLLEKLKSLSDNKSEEIAGLLQTMIRNESDYDFQSKSTGGTS